MLTEDEITNEIKKYLITKGWRIIQFSPPGGSLANPFKIDNGGNIFIDIIAVKNEKSVIFENKSSFNNKDVKKLRKIQLQKNLFKQLSFIAQKKHHQLIKKAFFFHGHNHKYVDEKIDEINLFFVNMHKKIKTNFDKATIC